MIQLLPRSSSFHKPTSPLSTLAGEIHEPQIAGALVAQRVGRKREARTSGHGNQTILVASLGQFTGAQGQVEFIRMTGRSEDETDAMFCQQSAQLMVKVNATTPIVQIMQLNGLPVCRPADGTVIVPIQ